MHEPSFSKTKKIAEVHLDMKNIFLKYVLLTTNVIFNKLIDIFEFLWVLLRKLYLNENIVCCSL